MDSHFGIMLVCLLVLANGLTVNGKGITNRRDVETFEEAPEVVAETWEECSQMCRDMTECTHWVWRSDDWSKLQDHVGTKNACYRKVSSGKLTGHEEGLVIGDRNHGEDESNMMNETQGPDDFQQRMSNRSTRTGARLTYVSHIDGPGCGKLSITTSSECGTAASSLGFSQNVQSGYWNTAPPGCIVGYPSDWKRTFFNTHATGTTGKNKYKSLCHKGAILNYVSHIDGPGCGKLSITTSLECGTAASSLGFSQNVQSGNWNTAPPGCMVGYPSDWKKTFFNIHATGTTGKNKYKSLCHKGAILDYVSHIDGPGCGKLSITTSSECGTAASSLGFSQNVQSGNWNTAPPGCMVGYPSDWKKTFFNIHATGTTGKNSYKSLCHKDAILDYVSLSDGPGCAKLSIRTSSECGTAASSLGFSQNVQSGNWNTAPPGCMVGYPSDWKKTFFNIHATGTTGKNKYKSLCHKGAILDYVSYNDGPGCGKLSITTSSECGIAASSLGFSQNVQSGNWNTAPPGCMVGYPSDWKKSFFNTHATGTTGKNKYKSLCHKGLFSDPVKACLKNNNNEVIASITLKECKDKCYSATSFTCNSLDYSESGSCFLSEESKKTQPSSYTEPCYDGSDCLYLEKKIIDRLHKGQNLLGEEFIRSQSGEHDLVMQSDGNLVIYRNFNHGRIATYATGTSSGSGSYFVFQGDGNLVIYKEDRTVLWATNILSQSADSLVMQNDGNLVLYAANNALWASNTVACKCGVKKHGTRIVGGVESQVNEYPWMVKLSMGCGGSVIADRWVLTAAHCFYRKGVQIITNPSTVTITLGEHDRTVSSETLLTKTVTPDKIIIHNSYDSIYTNDLALLRLPSVIDVNVYTPVCLPMQGAVYTDQKVWVYGWGALSDGGSSPATLQELEITVVDDDIAKKEFGLTDTQLAVTVFAGGEKGKDACQGDSGGPLSYDRNGQHELVGATSFGYGCAKDGYPGAYTELSAFRSWIDQKIAGANTC